MREQFDELLPWYINGTLEPAQRQWVEQYIAAHPQAKSELDFHIRLRDRMVERYQQIPEDVGLAKAMQKVAAEPRVTSTATKATRSAESAQSGKGLFAWLFGDGWLKPAFAACALALIAQSVLFYKSEKDHAADALRFRGAPAQPAQPVTTPTQDADGAILKVVFTPTATEAEIRLMLAATHGWMAGGPGTSGEYYIRYSADHVQKAADTIKASGISQSVSPAPSVPKHP